MSFILFLLVPTGKAKDLLDLELAPDEYETTLLDQSAERERQPIMVKTDLCAALLPHHPAGTTFPSRVFSSRWFRMPTDTAFLP